jgi:hypothetical protein
LNLPDSIFNGPAGLLFWLVIRVISRGGFTAIHDLEAACINSIVTAATSIDKLTH